MSDDDFTELIDVCCKVHETVKAFGTADMHALTSALLHMLALEVARRSRSDGDGDPASGRHH